MNRLTAWSCALLLLCGVLPAAAQPLRFSDDGTFRIVQFTDTHLCAGEWLPESEKTFARISRVIATERPDLVVFTGDVVTGRPAEGLWRRLLDTLQRCGAPFWEPAASLFMKRSLNPKKFWPKGTAPLKSPLKTSLRIPL